MQTLIFDQNYEERHCIVPSMDDSIWSIRYRDHIPSFEKLELLKFSLKKKIYTQLDTKSENKSEKLKIYLIDI